jgi:hypothetical protein
MKSIEKGLTIAYYNISYFISSVSCINIFLKKTKNVETPGSGETPQSG